MTQWLRQQGYALRHALQQLARRRSGFLLNALVVAIALALPFGGLTVLQNIRPLSEQLAIEPEVSLFLAPTLPRTQADALAPQIKRLLGDAQAGSTLVFVPRERALDALKEESSLADAVAALGSNPLPDAYVLKLASFNDAKDAGRIDTLVAQLKALPGVDQVQVDSAWVKRLAALLHIVRIALALLAATLGIAVIAVVFNTIRLQVLNQQEEIAVARLVGATDSFICQPFYYSGAVLGLCAGALALGIVAAALQPLNHAIAEFARLYGSEFALTPLGIGWSAALLAISAALGWLGALLSVRRQLRLRDWAV